MIRLEHVSIEFGRRKIVSDFNLAVGKGQLVCLMGESGCGKTSVLRALLGFVPVSSGRIWMEGDELSLHTVHHIRHITAYVPQELALPSEWVSEMVRLPFELKANQHIRFEEEKLFQYWDMLGLSRDLYQSKVCRISGGQRQRIMLAAAAMLDKDILLIDEPTSALDSDSSGRVFRFFSLLKEQGKTILAVTHDRKFASGCDRTVNM